MPNKLTPEREMSRRTRRGFMALGAGAVVAAGGWQWLNAGYKRGGDIPSPLRTMLRFNERVVRSALFSDDHLVKTYPSSAIGELKENGDFGLPDDFDADSWNLRLMPLGGGLPVSLTMDDLRRDDRFQMRGRLEHGNAVRRRAVLRVCREVRAGFRECGLRCNGDARRRLLRGTRCAQRHAFANVAGLGDER